jgi:hypothetical protein
MTTVLTFHLIMFVFGLAGTDITFLSIMVVVKDYECHVMCRSVYWCYWSSPFSVCVMPPWWAQGSWAKVWILRTCFWTVMFTHFGGWQPVAAAGVLFIQQWRVCESWACWAWALDLRSWGRGVCVSLSLPTWDCFSLFCSQWMRNMHIISHYCSADPSPMGRQ